MARQLVLGATGAERAVMPALLDDPTGHRENCIRITVQKRLRCVQALGQPGVTVKGVGPASRDGAKAAFTRGSADLLEFRCRRRKEGLGFAITACSCGGSGTDETTGNALFRAEFRLLNCQFRLSAFWNGNQENAEPMYLAE